MKSLKFIALAMLFATANVEFIEAKKSGKHKPLPCPKGQMRTKGSTCHTPTENERKSRMIAKQKKIENNSVAMKATIFANNAINAYNQALINGINKGDAVQTTAINAINNLINVYNAYLNIVTACESAEAVTFITKASASNGSIESTLNGTNQNTPFSQQATPMNQDAMLSPSSFGSQNTSMVQGAMLSQSSFGNQSTDSQTLTAVNSSSNATSNSSFSCPNSPSLCDDGSTATCDDQTPIGQFVCDDATPTTSLGSPCNDGTTSTYACDDQTTPDANGICGDGSSMLCGDGSNPTCTDYSSPC